ncbi:MAG: hypothetical protein KAI66_12245 [Lentisphaeria bacterium]|nr:hypothetical protein [Lentisphaeria bacterium]
MHHPDPKKHRRLFRIGLFLFIVNFPVGYGGIAICGTLAVVLRQREWLWVGAGAYAFSWILLGVGFYLSGQTGWLYAKNFWKRRKRLEKLREIRAKRVAKRRERKRRKADRKTDDTRVSPGSRSKK